MPIMDGWSFAEQYRRVAKQPAAIIVMSSVRDLEGVSRSLGAAHHLQKPFDLASLTRLVAGAITPPPTSLP
jgi:CheY-like chemotaxis protein